MPDEQIDQDKQEQDVQEDVVASQTPADLPEEVKERTKLEFEKLKEHNRQLAEEVERLKATPKESVLESLSPKQMGQAQYPNLNQQQVDDVIKGLVDENGYLDEALLRTTLEKHNREVMEAKALAEQARQEALRARSEVSKFEETREVRIAHKKFPNVDPESKSFDPAFFKQVKNTLIGAMYDGRKLSFVDACREVAEVYSPKTDKQEAKAKAVQEYKENIATKSALNQTGTQRPSTKASKEDLVEGTMRGDVESINARLANI